MVFVGDGSDGVSALSVLRTREECELARSAPPSVRSDWVVVGECFQKR